MATATLPYYFSGTVVHGFGRGGKQLGMPTANMDASAVEALPPDLAQGVFYGLAQLAGGPVFRMVMSIGTNPHFNNEKRTIEVHLLHRFDSDFYDQRLNGLIVGFIRDMRKFDSLDDLIKELKHDVEQANARLDVADIRSLEMMYFKKASL